MGPSAFGAGASSLFTSCAAAGGAGAGAGAGALAVAQPSEMKLSRRARAAKTMLLRLSVMASSIGSRCSGSSGTGGDRSMGGAGEPATSSARFRTLPGMRIRTQLALAFLLLAVVPLTGIVLYSYYSSLRAVRRTADAQARIMAGEMEARVDSIKGELGRGVERLGEVPAGDLLAAARSHREGRTDPVLNQMVFGFGDAAPFVRGLEFIPAPAEHAPTENGAPRPAPVAPSAASPTSIPRIVIDVPRILQDARRQAEAAE